MVLVLWGVSTILRNWYGIQGQNYVPCFREVKCQQGFTTGVPVVSRFQLLEGMMGESPPPVKNFAHSPPPGKIPTQQTHPTKLFFFPHQRLIFMYNPIQTSSLAAYTVILISYSLYTQAMLILILVDVQY